MFLINSRLGLFTAALIKERLFSRSYETNLPSSLTMNHSSTLGYSPRLPVSVCGTGRYTCFSWKLFHDFASRGANSFIIYPNPGPLQPLVDVVPKNILANLEQTKNDLALNI